MKNLIQISLMLWLVSSAAAQAQPAQPWQKTLHVFDWKDSKLQPELSGSEKFSTNGVSVLKIENTNNAPLEISLLTITNSSLIAKADSISCEIKHEDVRTPSVERTNYDFRRLSFTTLESGSLTFLQHIPPEAPGGDEITNKSAYNLGGTSNWKPYGFSVGRAPGEGLPTKLELQLYLPGNGTVYLRPIKLSGVVSSWWSAKQGGMVGGMVGIFGGIIGCFGGLLGCLAGTGKARKFVLTTTKIFIGLGMILKIAGIVAIAFRQPYFVWYVFLLPGVILTLVFSLNFPSIQRRYDDLEIRRMASLDV